MKKGGINPNVKLELTLPHPDEVSFAKFLTQSGTFRDGDLLVNRDGVRIVSQTETQPQPPITPSDNQLSLEDMDMVKVIGKGSSGIVQLVQHKWTSQFFALKIIQMNIEESARKAIAQELKINQSSQYFLKSVKTIPEPHLAAICKQVLKGLLYLHHEKHIIHRDLKPSNLLVNHRGEVKITDFGVSAIMESTSGQANSFVGTYNYMSPERISGDRYSSKSDIWSLGVGIAGVCYRPIPIFPSRARGMLD
ncbi:MITOGEN-ACTIVATED KINASE KINASE KINASE [Salix viminalis]|uniref:mitogen-activated protein kinase kinase n=1 Tax=Salix viminalis TaxID=40686 RepID=A0A9Q0SEL5_SALVM|nr:MITOGEN-ACTIVATED KINASE KINASE KINASE [Salix viminalis]